MDRSDFMHFVNSVRWHCTILMKTTRLNEDIDRAVRGVCDIRPEYMIMQSQNSKFYRDMGVGRLTVFNELEVLTVHFDEHVRVNLDFLVNF